MNILEKFYSDALQITQSQDFQSETIKEALCGLFCRTVRSYDKSLILIAEDITQHWIDSHQNDSADGAVQWFYAVFLLLDNSLSADMDFDDADWEALQDIVTDHADSLSVEFLQSFMNTVLARHKID